MATTAAGQTKLRQMINSGMGRQQALNLLIKNQRNQQPTGAPAQTAAPAGAWDDERGGFNPNLTAAPANPVSATGPQAPAGYEGWTWDDERGGFMPPAGNGSAVNESQPDIYYDPVYLRQLGIAQGAFNNARTNALAEKEIQTLDIQDELQARKPTAEQARRRLAGNFAARGMGGGRSGALSRAEATQNAQELSARTTLRDKISELNRQFVANYGAEGSDWLGTTAGAAAQSEALQAAVNARLAGITTVG